MLFKIGDVVKLKSGGPKMTVVGLPKDISKIDEAWVDLGISSDEPRLPHYKTNWFAGQKKEDGEFPEDSLERASDEK